jgi:hypothetical protein
MPVERIISEWRPGSQDWTWDDEQRDIAERVCCCRSHECESPSIGAEGHYQRQIVDKLRDEGEWWDAATILLGNDGRVWDGHHRILAAIELEIKMLTVEIVE